MSLMQGIKMINDVIIVLIKVSFPFGSLDLTYLSYFILPT